MGRRQQLEKLIAARARGKTSAFARLIGRSDAVVYQLRSGHRLLGDALARHIEICCGLPQGWLDTDEAVPPEGGSAFDSPPIRSALPVVLDAIAMCPHRDEKRRVRFPLKLIKQAQQLTIAQPAKLRVLTSRYYDSVFKRDVYKHTLIG